MHANPANASACGLDRWPPELRRAVMVARPNFFTWPAAQQLRWRVQLPDDDRSAIVTALLRAHGQRRPAALVARESHGRVPHALQNCINAWLQPLQGIGADAFSLSEYFAEGSSLLDFDTLLAYDRDDHAFQQGAKQKDIPGYVPQPYTGALNGTWARMLLDDGALCYLTLSMAAWHLCDAMEEAASAEIDTRIPHRHVRGPEDGQRDARGNIRWDMRVDANGQEALLDALQRRVWVAQTRRSNELAQLYCTQPRAACYLDDQPWTHEPPDEHNLRVVFTDPDALAAVRFTSFLRDCQRIERPLAELRAVQAQEARRMRDFVATQHDDLLKNFDPTVVPLRKNFKVMVHPDALRDVKDDGLL